MKVGAMSYAKLIRYLMEGTLTCNELAIATGLHPLTVYQYTRALHKERVIHIAFWEGEGRSKTKIYMLGNKPDAKRIKKDRSVISREYRERKKQMELNQRMAGSI